MLLNLTQAGRRKAKDIRGRGAEYSFLVSISESGPASVQDIASDLRIPPKAAAKLANRLISTGLIRREE